MLASGAGIHNRPRALRTVMLPESAGRQGRVGRLDRIGNQDLVRCLLGSRTRLRAIAGGLVSGIVVVLPTFAAVPDDGSLRRIEAIGREIHQAIESGWRYDLTRLSNRRALRSEVGRQRCPGMKYDFYRIRDTPYVIASARTGVVIGRHMKFDVVGESVIIESMTPSTETCLALVLFPAAPALVVTHVRSDLPTEFHALASLVSGRVIYVETPTGTWKVEAGTVSLL
jgi:hypothetical protein